MNESMRFFGKLDNGFHILPPSLNYRKIGGRAPDRYAPYVKGLQRFILFRKSFHNVDDDLKMVELHERKIHFLDLARLCHKLLDLSGNGLIQELVRDPQVFKSASR